MLAGTATALIAQDPPSHGDGPGLQDAGRERRQGPGPGSRADGWAAGRPSVSLGPAMHELDLTDDPASAAEAPSRSRTRRNSGRRTEGGAAREAMRALIEADQIDEGAIRAKSVEVAAAEVEMAILNAKVRQQSMQVLTSEQQAS